MSSYQYRKSYCGDKTILRPSYLHNGISYTGKTTSLYWIGALVVKTLPSPERKQFTCLWYYNIIIETEWKALSGMAYIPMNRARISNYTLWCSVWLITNFRVRLITNFRDGLEKLPLVFEHGWISHLKVHVLSLIIHTITEYIGIANAGLSNLYYLKQLRCCLVYIMSKRSVSLSWLFDPTWYPSEPGHLKPPFDFFL